MPSYTFTLNVETKIAEARLRAFRATAEKELSSIQAATTSAAGGVGRRGGISGGGGSSGGYGGGSVVVGRGQGAKDAEKYRAAAAKAELDSIAGLNKLVSETAKIEQELDNITMRSSKERIAIREKEANAAIADARRANREVMALGKAQSQALVMNEKFNKGQLDGRGLPTQKAVSNQWSNLDHVLKTGFLAYGTYLVASKAIAGIYDFGKVGAQQERTAQTFEQLAQRIGVSADGMRAAVQRASHGTIDEMTGMGLSAQVLAQNFAGSLDDIEGDTEILIRAARRFSQVYTDENGQNLSTQAIYARLIKFSREGNKELVDQFGLSNELIANLLNIPNEGLRGAEGAENRWKGMIMALELELKKLGEATGTPADKIEAAEARWTKAVDKIRESTIGLSTGMAEAAAGVTEYFSRVPSDYKIITSTRPEMERIQKLGADGTNNSAVNNAVRQFLEIDTAWVQGKISQDEYWEAVNDSIQQFYRLNEVLESFRPNLDTAIVALTQGAALTREDFPGTSGGASAALRQQAQARQHNLDVLAGTASASSLSEDERDYRLAVGNAAEKVRIFQAAVDAAEKGTTEYWKAKAELNGAQLALAGDIDAVKGKFMGLQSDIEQYQLDLRLGAAGNDAEKRAILQGLNLSDSTPEGRRNALEIQSLDRSIAQENRRLGEEAQREWKQTAKEVEQMFESAADKIMGIPGVTSMTPVTDQDMLDTRYGVYKDKADEWIRRVRGELQDFDRDVRKDEYGNVTETLRPRKTTDYPDVSREQVEKITGMPAGLPWDVLVPKLEGMLQSGSLYADKNNLGLMNMDSIRASYEEMKQGATGRQNQRQYIMEQLGVSMSDAALITGTQAPIVQMMTGGQSEEEITAQLGPVANTLRSAAMASLTSGTGFMAEISAGWKKDIDENITKLDPLGDMIGKRLRDRINTTIGGLGLIDGIVARVIAELADGGV